MKILLIPLSILMFTYCAWDPAPPILHIKNKSSHDVYIYMTDADSIPLKPELILKYKQSEGRSVDTEYFIKKDTDGYLPMRGVRHNFPFHGDTARFFFISKETVDRHSWTDIHMHQLYEKKVTLTKKEMKRMGWLYVYSTDCP